MPNTVLGDASRLIPDPDGLAQCLSKTMRPDSWIWDRFTDLVMASPLLGLDSKLIPDPLV